MQTSTNMPSTRPHRARAALAGLALAAGVAGASLISGAGTALAPEPAKTTQPLSGGTGASAVRPDGCQALPNLTTVVSA